MKRSDRYVAALRLSGFNRRALEYAAIPLQYDDDEDCNADDNIISMMMMVMIEIILIIEMILMLNYQSTSVTFCDVLRITSPNKMNASGDLEMMMMMMMMILMIIVHDDSDVDNDRDDVYDDDDAQDDDDSDHDDLYNYDRHSDNNCGNDDRIITYNTLFCIPWVKRCNFS